MKDSTSRFFRPCIMRTIVTLFACLISTVLCAAEPTKTILILDCSGSMWGKIQGRTKVDIAREAVAKVVGGLDANTQLGLMAYGHRRKGDCNDIELLIPPGPLNRAAFLAKVNALQPLGNTPLTRSVELAAEALKSEEQAATVVLVSDGLETCGGDPCALAAKLEKAGLKFTAHVIGFDLTKEESVKISCLATNTGGLYLPASDAGSLQLALQSVVASVPAKKTGASFLAKDSKTGAALADASWQVFKDKADEKPTAKLAAAQGTLDLAPGTYQAVASWKQQQVRVDFAIAEGQIVPVVAAFGPAIIHLIASETPDSPPLEAGRNLHFWTAITLAADGSEGQDYGTLDAQAAFELPPGKYRVKFSRGSGRYGEVAREEIVEVAAGEQRTVRFVVPSATVTVTVTFGGNKTTRTPWVEILGLNEQGEADTDRRMVNVNENPIPAILPPGKYEARSELGAAKASGQFTVEAGKDSAYTLDYAAGFVKARATLKGQPVKGHRWWIVYATNAAGEKDGPLLFHTLDAELDTAVPEGDFIVTTEVDGEEIPGIRVKVVKGKTIETTLPLPK
jgi:Ca-activated chloride channel family protein